MENRFFPDMPILVVDNEKIFLDSIDFELRANGITNLDICIDSREVMSRLKENKYALVLLDLIMPHISGEELLPEIVKYYKDVPVIVVTAHADTKTLKNCMKMGAFDYLLKPFETKYLIKKIQDALGLKNDQKGIFQMKNTIFSKNLNQERARGSLDFISTENVDDVLKEFDFSNENDTDHSKALLKIDFLLRTGKAQKVIAKVAPVIKNKKINESNVGLFYVLGRAYEKIENFGKAEEMYSDIAKFDPGYPDIQNRLEKIENIKKDLSKIYHRERYSIIEEVGQGGFGVVYKAKDNTLGRIVALKILKTPIPGKRDVERLFSEAKKIAKLPYHANIVGAYDHGYIENDYFISMEFIEGKDLRTIIRNKHPIPIPDTLVIAKKLFSALAHSHRNGIIHRDIKPSNIMITYENEVKVVDFGIAILRDELKREDRIAIYGTPSFMSPEQLKNLTTDHLTDIYSAGVNLFYLVTGIIPFKGNSHVEIVEKHLYEPVPSIKEYRGDVPDKLIQIIEKCMKKNKKDRYQSAEIVIKEIYGVRDSSGKAFITSGSTLNIFDAK